MHLLISGATQTVRKYDPTNLGALITPRSGNNPEYFLGMGLPVAMDNDCFQGLNREQYILMLKKNAPIAPHVLWVTAPDIVGNAGATLARFNMWKAPIRYFGYKIAFVAQDGLEDLTPPWQEFECLFIGGTTAWKVGPAAARLILEAKHRGKWVHMGRVNSIKRILYAGALGCDSVDGTGFSKFTDDRLPPVLPYLGLTQSRFHFELAS